MNVSIAIQAHPSRKALVDALRATLPASEAVFDPEPEAALTSPWRTYRAALESTPPDATHRLIIQDDAEVAATHFAEAVDLIAACWPDRLVTLFLANSPRLSARALFKACERGERYAVLPTKPWVPAIALLWPTSLISPVLAFVDEQTWPPGFCADDEIIGRAMTALFQPLIATIPSLVEHPDEVESILGRRRNMAGRDLSRVAACFIDGDLDPLDFDWSARP